MKSKIETHDEGINGLGHGIVNVNSQEFKELQKEISSQAKRQSNAKTLENKLLSLRFKMESYLLIQDGSYVEAGYFLKEFLRELNIKNKTFAEYIDFKESNLSALFSGKRKINYDLALKLGKIFPVKPTLWIHIQSKNELIRLEKENKKEYQNYSLDALLKKAS